MEISVLIGICDVNERNTFINQMRSNVKAVTELADDGIDLCLKAFRRKPDVIVIDDEFIFRHDRITMKKIMEECKYTSLVLISSMQDSSIKEIYGGLADVVLARPLRGREFIPNILVNVAQKRKLGEIENNIKKVEEEFLSSKHMSFALYFIMDNFGFDEEQARKYMDALKKSSGYDLPEIAEIIFSLFASKK